MHNKSFRKIIVYLMVFAMFMSTLLMGLAFLL